MRSACAALVLLSVTCPCLGFEACGARHVRCRASVSPALLPGRIKVPSQTFLLMTTTANDATRLATRDELLELISSTPRNAPTPKSTTAEILEIVKKLESMCPTEEDNVLNSLSGGWELLWTAQVSLEYSFRSFLHILSYVCR